MISTNVRRLCKLLANCEFALHRIWNSRFSTFSQSSSKKETTHDRSCELLVKCEFAEVTHLGHQNPQKN